eukprot:261046-Rhodomonas_salina.1
MRAASLYSRPAAAQSERWPPRPNHMRYPRAIRHKGCPALAHASKSRIARAPSSTPSFPAPLPPPPRMTIESSIAFASPSSAPSTRSFRPWRSHARCVNTVFRIEIV